jgi:hypothetical protein
VKIPIRNPVALQNRIDRHVRAIENAGRAFGRYPRSGKGPSLPAMYNILLKAKRPMNYRDLTDALDLPQTVESHFPLSGRLAMLASDGYAVCVGRGPSKYHHMRGAKLYVAVPLDQVKRVQRRIHKAIKRMLDDPELKLLTYRINEVPQCVATRIGPTPYLGRAVVADRNREMIELRLGGMSLNKIGAKYGITRERVRQIVENAVAGRRVNGFEPRPHKIDFDEGRRTLRYLKGLSRYPKERGILLDVSKAILRMKESSMSRQKQYSEDQVRRVVGLRNDGKSVTEIIGLTNLGQRTVYRILAEHFNRQPKAVKIKARDWPEAAIELRAEDAALAIIQNQLNKR